MKEDLLKPNTYNKLLDLLHTMIMAPCRTKADADAMEVLLEEIRKEVASDGLPIMRCKAQMESGNQPPCE